MRREERGRTIAFVVYPGLTLLELIGPITTFFGLTRSLVGPSRQYRTVTVGERRLPPPPLRPPPGPRAEATHPPLQPQPQTIPQTPMPRPRPGTPPTGAPRAGGPLPGAPLPGGPLPGTPLPGEAGNASIAGHRTTYGAPFNRLDELEAGDEILVTTAQGSFTYEVREQLIVSPDQVEVLDPTELGDVAAGHPST